MTPAPTPATVASSTGLAAPRPASSLSPTILTVAVFVLAALCGLGDAHALGTASHRTAAGERAPLRIAYTHVDVVADGDVVTTDITAVVVNDLPTDVEATYRFPLPDDATVTGFSEVRDGVALRATLADKDAARDAYEDAAAEGREASLVEAEARDAGESGRVFTMRLATIPAEGTRRVVLSFAQTVEPLGGDRTWLLPAGSGHSAVDRLPPTVLDVDVSVRASGPIRRLDVPNQADARVSIGGDRGRVRLSRTRESLALDLAVTWRVPTTPLELAGRAAHVPAPDGAHTDATLKELLGDPLAVGPTRDEAAVLDVRFAFHGDPWAHEAPPRQVVVVLDTSTSMAGEPLNRARVMAEAVLAELTPRDTVELVTFADLVTQHLGSLAPADELALGPLLTGLGALRAHGRSNLQAALDVAADLLADQPNGVLLLVTDGQPTVGAGYGMTRPLRVDAEALAHSRVVVAHTTYPTRQEALEALLPQATTRHLPSGRAGDDALDAVLTLALAPTIEDLRVHLEGGDVHGVEGEVPARLAMGQPLRLLARAHGDVHAVVEGTLHGRPLTLETVVRVPARAARVGRAGQGLAVAWATRRLERLDRAYTDPERSRSREEYAAAIRRLGARFGLATRFTSWVVTDGLSPDRIKPGDPEIRVRAARSALGARAVLPWGERVALRWSAAEGLWLGRFLVPRTVDDGLYKARIFVDGQGGTVYRGALFFRVDSVPPAFALGLGDRSVVVSDAEGAEVTVVDGMLHLVATPVSDVFVGRGGDSMTTAAAERLARVDLKRVSVDLGAAARERRQVTLERVETADGVRWEASLPLTVLPAGRHVLRLVATDYARNSAEAELTVWVPAEALALTATSAAAPPAFADEACP